jgi:S-adenosyl-L-methionine hydrolase (adenosine-forming)
VRPVIALLSDFGTRDHYAGTMKAVMIGICADVTFVDITHDITPHDVMEGALQLAASCRYFPAGTIFLSVVDPGVGSSRRGIAVEAGDYRFVAPDNGVLTAALRDAPVKRIVELTERRYARPTVSRTFEGRDRFAPAAAWLAKGIQLSALGRALTPYHQIEIPQPQVGEQLAGVVLLVDRFGNLVTNIDRRTFEAFTRAQPVALKVDDHPIAGVVATYSDIRAGEVCALFGSTEHLEFAVNGGSAAGTLHVAKGAKVEITRK